VPQTLVVVLVPASRLPAVTLHWLAFQLYCLQSVLNAAARSVAGLRRSDHTTDTPASFHWLRVPEQIRFKLAVVFSSRARHCISVSVWSTMSRC